MSYTDIFILSLRENGYLDFQNLGLTNDELDKFIKVFENKIKKACIRQINLASNNLHQYDISKLLKVFYNAKNIIVSDMNNIDNQSNKNISITVG